MSEANNDRVAISCDKRKKTFAVAVVACGCFALQHQPVVRGFALQSSSAAVSSKRKLGEARTSAKTTAIWDSTLGIDDSTPTHQQRRRRPDYRRKFLLREGSSNAQSGWGKWSEAKGSVVSVGGSSGGRSASNGKSGNSKRSVGGSVGEISTPKLFTQATVAEYEFPMGEDFNIGSDFFSFSSILSKGDDGLSSSPVPDTMTTINFPSLQRFEWSLGDEMKKVVSAALLITSNTVGASILCLPDYAAGPGLQVSSALLLGIFGINLLSGLLIAEVAIKQYEASIAKSGDNDNDGADVPSSFKDFADATLHHPMAGNAIAVVSIFANMCVLSYSLMQAGDVARDYGMDGSAVAVAVGLALIALLSSVTTEALSGVASVACAVLFASFGGMVLPGLANVHDPIGTLLAPGTAALASAAAASSSSSLSSVMDSAASAVPIFLSAMVYQNIVPSITKLLDYDRTKSIGAIFLGSLIPTAMYLSYSFGVLGGGIDTNAAAMGGGSALLTAFSIAALAGSSIACVMSIAEEFDSVLGNIVASWAHKHNDGNADAGNTKGTASAQQLSFPSVALAVGPPLLAGLLLSGGEGFSAALQISGGYAVPALYGLLPVVLYASQCREEEREKSVEMTKKSRGNGGRQSVSTSGSRRNTSANDNGVDDFSFVFSSSSSPLVPGGFASLSVLGAASVGFVGQEFASDLGSALSVAASSAGSLL